jgi:methanogenic corrinoid protein MtbC1
MNEAVVEELKNVVLTCDRDKAEPAARKAIDQGVDPVACAEVIADALKIVGDRYSTGEAFLPDLLLGSKVANVALRLITEEIRKQGESMKSLGKVVIGTVFGDIYSTGKAIVATLLSAAGRDRERDNLL